MSKNIDKVSFPYRATTHLAFLHVVGQSGSWAKHGLDVNYDWQISKSDAHKAVASGEVEFVGGNHISTYGKRARGDQCGRGDRAGSRPRCANRTSGT